MFQDFEGHTFHTEFSPVEPKENDLLFFNENGKVLLKEENAKYTLFTYGEKNEVFFDNPTLTHLFHMGDISFFMVEGTLREEKRNCLYTTEYLRRGMSGWRSFGSVCALHITRWYKRRKFCPSCGKKMVQKKDERAMLCENCHNIEYPMIAPVVIVGIRNKDKLLLSKYALHANATKYYRHSLIAGFVEFGETLEDAAKREVMEEVGLKIKNLTYYKSQPWGFSGSLLMGFFADVDGSDEIQIDERELSEAEWFEREHLPKDDSTYSLTWDMIEKFRNEK